MGRHTTHRLESPRTGVQASWLRVVWNWTSMQVAVLSSHRHAFCIGANLWRTHPMYPNARVRLFAGSIRTSRPFLLVLVVTGMNAEAESDHAGRRHLFPRIERPESRSPFRCLFYSDTRYSLNSRLIFTTAHPICTTASILCPLPTMPSTQSIRTTANDQDSLLTQIVSGLPKEPFRRFEVYGQMCARYLVYTFNCSSKLHMKNGNTTQTPLHKLSNFIWYLFYRTKLPAPVIFSSLVLIHRLKCTVDASDRSIIGHRIILATTMLSAKYLMDRTYDNKSWRLASGRLFALKEVNKMERDMCALLDWDLTIDKQTLENFAVHFMHDFGRTRSSYPIYPYSMVSKRMALSPDDSSPPAEPDASSSGIDPPDNDDSHLYPSVIGYSNVDAVPASVVHGTSVGHDDVFEESGSAWRVALESPSAFVPPAYTPALAWAGSPASIPLPQSPIQPHSPVSTDPSMTTETPPHISLGPSAPIDHHTYPSSAELLYPANIPSAPTPPTAFISAHVEPPSSIATTTSTESVILPYANVSLPNTPSSSSMPEVLSVGSSVEDSSQVVLSDTPTYQGRSTTMRVDGIEFQLVLPERVSCTSV
ncbi:hypothetical protein NMY22_g10042 [Coprinellus aureogranulatus]|nr:hypothetical protein NMY22_g10042 [Coprinellus aureogranulatus]